MYILHMGLIVLSAAVSYELHFPRDHSQVDSNSCEIKKRSSSKEAVQMAKHIFERQLKLIICRVHDHTVAGSIKKLLRLIVSSILYQISNLNISGEQSFVAVCFNELSKQLPKSLFQMPESLQLYCHLRKIQ